MNLNKIRQRIEKRVKEEAIDKKKAYRIIMDELGLWYEEDIFDNAENIFRINFYSSNYKTIEPPYLDDICTKIDERIVDEAVNHDLVYDIIFDECGIETSDNFRKKFKPKFEKVFFSVKTNKKALKFIQEMSLFEDIIGKIQ